VYKNMKIWRKIWSYKYKITKK